MKAIANRYLPKLLGTSRRGGTSGYGYGKSGASNRYYRSSGLGYSRNVASNPAPDDLFEMGQQNRNQSVDITGPVKGRTNTASPSLSDEESGVMGGGIGIVKTTDLSIREENVGSIDSLV